MIKLILKLKGTQIEEFILEKDQIHIGRAKDNDIVIDKIIVSRKHAQITRKEGVGYVLRDLNSSNGTFLNGEQIDASDHPLSEGAIIGIAKFEIQVMGLSKAAQPPPKTVTQEDPAGTMIFDAASRRKPIPEAQAPPEPKVIRWPVLSAVKGPTKGTEYKITKEITMVGKGLYDIPAVGWFVSSPHAKITRRGDRFYISHLGGFLSSTKVNGIGIGEDHILKKTKTR